MAYEDIPIAYINIAIGGTYSESWNLTDEAGAPLTASDGWTGRAEIRTEYGGPLVASFGEGGAGTVEFDEQGNITLTLPSTATSDLPSTQTRSGNNSLVFVGDVEVWQTSAPTVRYRALILKVRIYQEVFVS